MRGVPARCASWAAAALLAAGCATAGSAPTPAATDTRVHVTLLHLNDIYEITPVGGGRWGGPARVATLRKQLLAENPNTFTLVAGDLFSPSALGTARVDGERLAGRQMVAVLNEMGLDFATFGNHEFDIGEAAVLERLRESRFHWLSGNVVDSAGRPFPDVSLDGIIEVEGPMGVARIGLIGVTYDGIQPDFVRFSEPLQAVEARVAALRDSVDALLALTHLQTSQDIALAERLPELDLILGGHDHENVALWRGADMTPSTRPTPTFGPSGYTAWSSIP